MLTFEAYAEPKLKLINGYIESSISRLRRQSSQRFSLLLDAMQYSLEGGGKRFRPLLVVASAECLGLSASSVLPAACAIEFVHTYSLIHDDLPALDDDDFRRGKPSNHKKFGEAVAILAGDGLITEAFGQMALLMENGNFSAAQVLAAIDAMVCFSGIRGMVGGQILDVTIDTATTSLPEVEFIHIHKTGAMILGSVMVATKLTPLEEARSQRLRRFGEALGLAFQISDDILDAETSIRYSRGPRKKPKPSYAQLMSPSEMKEKLNGLINTALQSLETEGRLADPLRTIAEFIRTRKS